MINAEKVIGYDGKPWIKVTYKPNQITDSQMRKIPGVMYDKKRKIWAVPWKEKSYFELLMQNFLINWVGQQVNPTAGGIDEKTISSQPVVPGYSVEYGGDGSILSATGFKKPPFGEYQVKGFNAIVERPFLILADEQGLGKTYQTVTALEAKKKLGQLRHGLIITKATLIYNWQKEIQQYTNEKALISVGTQWERCKLYNDLSLHRDWTFLIMSYETFRNDVSAIRLMHNMMIEYGDTGLDFCVLDEAHKVKNPMSKIGAAIHIIPFRYRYVLTATPLPNSPLEAYNYLKWGGKEDRDWYTFRHHYAILGGKNNREVIGYRNILEIRQKLQKNMLRRLKKDKIKELPDVVFRDITIPMTKKQQQIYDAIRYEIIEDLKETDLKRIPSFLAKLTRLQQVTDSLDLIGVPPSKQNSAKLLALDDLLEDLTEGGEKVIIFSRFKEMVLLMEKRYAKYRPAVVHGDIDSRGISAERARKLLIEKYPDFKHYPPEKQEKLISQLTLSARQREIDRFQEDPECKIFLGTSTAVREGSTLTAATHVVFVDTEWAWDYVEQAFSRAHRIGQKNAVTVHFLMCMNTIDIFVKQTFERKQSMSNTLLSGKIESIDLGTATEFIKTMIGA